MNTLLARLLRLPHWLIILGAALAARLPNLGNNLWYDEAWQAWVSGSGSSMVEVMAGDNHPPLWSLIQQLNLQLFGFSEVTFRLFPLIFGVANVLILWRIALRLRLERGTALTTGLLAAFMPSMIFFGQDARMYALLTTCVLVMVYAVMRGNWYLFFPAALAALYTHNIALLYVALIGLAGIFATKTPVRGLVTLAFAAGLYSPWLPNLIRQSVAMKEFWLPPFHVGQIVETLFGNTFSMWLNQFSPLLGIAGIGTAVAMTGTGFLISRKWLATRGGLTVLAAMVGVPLAAAAISATLTNIYVWRAFQPSAWLMLMVWAYPLHHLTSLNRMVARRMFVPLLVAAVIAYWATGRTDVYGWLAPIRENWQVGDVIYHPDPATQVIFGWYAQGYDSAIRPARGTLISVSDSVKAATHWQTLSIGQLAERYRRAWVIVSEQPFNRADELLETQALFALYPPMLIQETPRNAFHTDRLYLLDLRTIGQ